MLKYNLNKAFRLRGIASPVQFLIGRGYNKDTAYRLLNNGIKSLQLYQIEDICKWLNCTPNDMLEWIPELNENATDYSALKQLMPENNTDFLNATRDIPLNKIPELLKKVVEKKLEL
jgi:hypothetical protein